MGRPHSMEICDGASFAFGALATCTGLGAFSSFASSGATSRNTRHSINKSRWP